MDQHFYEPRLGHGLPHDPFKAIIAPRPIGWISSVDPDGRVNLAPYSYFNGFGSAPPVVAFGSEGRKDSVRNIEATGEFVCNFVTRELAEAMNQSCAPLPHGMSEFEHAGLEAAPCRLVRPPRVAASPAALECRVLQVVSPKDLDGNEIGTHIVLGQVVGVHINRAYLKDGLFDTKAARPIGRCGYRGDYAEIGEMFEMIRPNFP
ncbi:flavin reductase family protein [Roseomonas populi]|uniref:Flavin reductase family protein n=1 Tax=Roseomonas populi TaxID=3121582 RepID=A0ABT1X8U8_9PROT|nr:flavin reductase family protein [Roseomonas pecuniae]MCR0984532.1 flavin reductase family protein [Roseomonas pecuniae]